MPVLLFSAVTVALGMTAPDESVTTPETCAVWANAQVAVKDPTIKTGPRSDNAQQMADRKYGVKFPDSRLPQLLADARKKKISMGFTFPLYRARFGA